MWPTKWWKMVKIPDALLPEPTLARVVRRDCVGGPALGVAAFSLHHVSQRGRSGHGAGVELVVGTEGYFMVEAVKIWAGIRRQGRSRRQSRRPPAQQERNAHHGRHPYRAGAQRDYFALGPMEHVRSAHL